MQKVRPSGKMGAKTFEPFLGCVRFRSTGCKGKRELDGTAEEIPELEQMQAVVEKIDQDRPPYCPDCGGMMVLRQRRRDKAYFWGCSQYPGCKGTMNIDPQTGETEARDEFRER